MKSITNAEEHSEHTKSIEEALRNSKETLLKSFNPSKTRLLTPKSVAFTGDRRCCVDARTSLSKTLTIPEERSSRTRRGIPVQQKYRHILPKIEVNECDSAWRRWSFTRL